MQREGEFLPKSSPIQFPKKKGGSSMGKRWQPLKLTPRHKEIMRRTLLGQSQVDIAKALGMTQVAVNQIVNSDIFQRNLRALQGTLEQMLIEGIVDRELNDPVRQKLDEYKLDAINEMFYLMKHAESETVRRASAADILDRAGYKPREVVETQHSFNVTGETEEHIKKALKDLGIETDQEPEFDEWIEGGEEDESI